MIAVCNAVLRLTISCSSPDIFASNCQFVRNRAKNLMFFESPNLNFGGGTLQIVDVHL